MALSCPERSVWLFDSWQGCPEPTERDFDCHGEPGRAGDFSASEHRTRTFLYGDLGLSQNRVRMVKGWFTETLGGAVETIGPIGLLHLDSDWYTSTREALEAIWDHVVPGGGGGGVMTTATGTVAEMPSTSSGIEGESIRFCICLTTPKLGSSSDNQMAPGRTGSARLVHRSTQRPIRSRPGSPSWLLSRTGHYLSGRIPTGE
jgi:hypothetical protein